MTAQDDSAPEDQPLSRTLALELRDCAIAGALPDEQFKTSWEEDLRTTIHDAANSVHDLTTALWSCAALNAEFRDEWTKKTAQGLYGEIEKTGYHREEKGTLRQLVHACLWFGFPCDARAPRETPPSPFIPARMRNMFENSRFIPNR